MPRSKRSTVVAKIDFENVNNAESNETTLGDELKEYLNAPPLISGYLERETRKAAGGAADGEGKKKRWWCQLKGPFLMQWEDDGDDSKDSSKWVKEAAAESQRNAAAEAAGTPTKPNVGDCVEVRDAGDGDWCPGVVDRVESLADNAAGFQVFVRKYSSDDAFIWDDWRWPPKKMARSSRYDLSHYDLKTHNCSVERNFDVEGRLESDIRIVNDLGIRPLPIGTQVEQKIDGNWECLGKVDTVHFHFEDESWKSPMPDTCIDLRLMDYSERSKTGDSLVLYSFNMNESHLWAVGDETAKLKDWETFLQKVIHNLKTMFLSKEQQKELRQQGIRGLLGENEESYFDGAWQLGNPLLPPSVFNTISPTALGTDTEAAGKVVEITVELPPELLRPTRAEGRHVWEKMRRQHISSAENGEVAFETDKSVIREAFDQADADNSGTLDLDEITELCKILGSDLQPHELQADLDEDGDGSVTFEEFRAWWMSLLPPRYEKIKVHSAPGRNFITYKEVRAALNARLLELSEKRDFELVARNANATPIQGWIFAHDIVKMPVPTESLVLIDKHSGQSLPDSAVLKRHKTRNEQSVRDAFNEADQDKNGSLDYHEVAVLCESLGTEMTTDELEAEMDADHDGTISFEKFETWWYKTADVEVRVDLKGSFLLMHLLDLDWQDAAVRDMAEKLHDQRHEANPNIMLEIGVNQGLRPVMETRLVEWWRIKLGLESIRPPAFAVQLDAQEIAQQKVFVQGIAESGIVEQIPDFGPLVLTVDETVYSLKITDPEATLAIALLLEGKKGKAALLAAGVLAAEGEAQTVPGVIVTAVALGSANAPEIKISVKARARYKSNPHTYGPKRMWVMAGESVIMDREVVLDPADEMLPARQYSFYDSATNLQLKGVTLCLSDGKTPIQVQQRWNQSIIEFPSEQLLPGEVRFQPKVKGYQTPKEVSVLSLNGVFKKGVQEQKIYLNPPPKNDEYRISLRWASKPRDLAIHMASSMGETCNWRWMRNKKDFDINGGEVITFERESGVKYVFYVLNFSGESEISKSKATLRITAASIDAAISVPRLYSSKSCPKYWRAFGIDEKGHVVHFGSSSDRNGFLVDENPGKMWSEAETATEKATLDSIAGFTHGDYEDDIDDGGVGELYGKHLNKMKERARQSKLHAKITRQIARMDAHTLASSCPVTTASSIPSSSMPALQAPAGLLGDAATNPYGAVFDILPPEEVENHPGAAAMVPEVVSNAMLSLIPGAKTKNDVQAADFRRRNKELLLAEATYACEDKTTQDALLDSIGSKDIGLLLKSFFGDFKIHGARGALACPMPARKKATDSAEERDIEMSSSPDDDKKEEEKECDEVAMSESAEHEDEHRARLKELASVILPALKNHVADSVPSILDLVKALDIEDCRAEVREVCDTMSFDELINVLAHPFQIIPQIIVVRKIRNFVDQKAACVVCNLLSQAVPDKLIEISKQLQSEGEEEGGEEEAEKEDAGVEKATEVLEIMGVDGDEEDEDESNSSLFEIDDTDQENLTEAFHAIRNEDIIRCLAEPRHAFECIIGPLAKNEKLMETRTKLIKVATFYFIESVGIIERSKELGVKESDLIVVASEIAVLVSKTIDEGVDEDVISEVPLELDENNEDDHEGKDAPGSDLDKIDNPIDLDDANTENQMMPASSNDDGSQSKSLPSRAVARRPLSRGRKPTLKARYVRASVDTDVVSKAPLALEESKEHNEEEEKNDSFSDLDRIKTPIDLKDADIENQKFPDSVDRKNDEAESKSVVTKSSKMISKGALKRRMLRGSSKGKNPLSLLMKNPFHFMRFLYNKLDGDDEDLPYTRKYFRKIAGALLADKIKTFFGVDAEDFSTTGGDPTSHIIQEFVGLMRAPEGEDDGEFPQEDASELVVATRRTSNVGLRESVENATNEMKEMFEPPSISECLSLGSGAAMKLFKMVCSKLFNTLKVLLIPKFVTKMQKVLKFADDTARNLAQFLKRITIEHLTKAIRLVVVISTGFGSAAAPQMLTSFVLSSFNKEIAHTLQRPLTSLLTKVCKPVFRWQKIDCLAPLKVKVIAESADANDGSLTRPMGGVKYEIIAAYLQEGLAPALKFIGMCLDVPIPVMALISFVTSTILSNPRFQKAAGLSGKAAREFSDKIKRDAQQAAVRSLRSSLMLSASASKKMSSAMKNVDFSLKKNTKMFDFQGGSVAATTAFLANMKGFDKRALPDLHIAARAMALREMQRSALSITMPKFKLKMAMPTLPIVHLPHIGSTVALKRQLAMQSMTDLTANMSNMKNHIRAPKINFSSCDHPIFHQKCFSCHGRICDYISKCLARFCPTCHGICCDQLRNGFRRFLDWLSSTALGKTLAAAASVCKADPWKYWGRSFAVTIILAFLAFFIFLGLKLASVTFVARWSWMVVCLPIAGALALTITLSCGLSLRVLCLGGGNFDNAGLLKMMVAPALACREDPFNRSYWARGCTGFAILLSLLFLGLRHTSSRIDFAEFTWWEVTMPLIVVAAPVLAVGLMFGSVILCLKVADLDRITKQRLTTRLLAITPAVLLVAWVVVYAFACAGDHDGLGDYICQEDAWWYMPLIAILYAYVMAGFFQSFDIVDQRKKLAFKATLLVLPIVACAAFVCLKLFSISSFADWDWWLLAMPIVGAGGVTMALACGLWLWVLCSSDEIIQRQRRTGKEYGGRGMLVDTALSCRAAEQGICGPLCVLCRSAASTCKADPTYCFRELAKACKENPFGFCRCMGSLCKAAALTGKACGMKFYSTCKEDPWNKTYWARGCGGSSVLLLFVTFIILKMIGPFTDWSWWLVCSPILGAVAIAIIFTCGLNLKVLFSEDGNSDSSLLKKLAAPALACKADPFNKSYLARGCAGSAVLLFLAFLGLKLTSSRVVFGDWALWGVAMPVIVAAGAAGCRFLGLVCLEFADLDCNGKLQLAKSLLVYVPGLLLVIWNLVYGIECYGEPNINLSINYLGDDVCRQDAWWYMPSVVVVYAYIMAGFFRSFDFADRRKRVGLQVTFLFLPIVAVVAFVCLKLFTISFFADWEWWLVCAPLVASGGLAAVPLCVVYLAAAASTCRADPLSAENWARGLAAAAFVVFFCVGGLKRASVSIIDDWSWRLVCLPLIIGFGLWIMAFLLAFVAPGGGNDQVVATTEEGHREMAKKAAESGPEAQRAFENKTHKHVEKKFGILVSNKCCTINHGPGAPGGCGTCGSYHLWFCHACGTLQAGGACTRGCDWGSYGWSCITSHCDGANCPCKSRAGERLHG